jgi:hypothetical protein
MSRILWKMTRALLLLLPSTAALGAPQQFSYDSPPINYSKTKAEDRVAGLDARIAAKQTSLDYDGNRGYLKSLLKELDVPVSSQMLVYSKTSFQRQWITPHSPRAIYFNDDVYVGWVPGGEVLELAAQDPMLGTVFYTVAQDSERRPRFLRQTDNCLQCHDGTGLTLGVPGVTVRSVYSAADGQPRFNLGGFRTTYRSSFEERWGGWYVTGTHGSMRHMGNVSFPDDPNPDMPRMRDKGANLSDLTRKLDVEPYLADSSDIVALMVLEYQTLVHNLITRANHETRIAIVQSDEMNHSLGVPRRPLTEGSRRRIGFACEPLIEALLYCEEFKLSDPVKGTSTFRDDFEKRGPFDRQGRSLRQFDLTKRMFKVPFSYLVYSKAFQGLPDEAQACISARLKDILGGRDTRPEFAHLTGADHCAILEILEETLPKFAATLK